MNDAPRATSALLGLHTVFTGCFFISACTIAQNTNAGFTVIMVALMYIAYCGGGLMVLRQPNTLQIGFLMGVTCTLIIMSLNTAVYWGELSKCKKIEDGFHLSCENTSGMKAVSAFASLSFILELGLAFFLITRKDEFVSENSRYEDVGPMTSGYNNAPYNGGMGGGAQVPVSTDL
jgi:ABC-type arginine/histidine transport system permease subunit